MNRRSFIQLGAFFSAIILSFSSKAFKNKKPAIRLLRHATLVLELGGVKFLVDPMLSPKDAMDPVKNARNDLRIPLVDLPISSEEMDKIISDVDAVIVTHTHRDHWDAVAQKNIAKDKLLFIQPSDEEIIRKKGFEKVNVVNVSTEFKGLQITRTGGQHGTGEIGLKMGTVSGFIISNGKTKVYVAGDTIWCSEVEQAIQKHQPDIIIVNAGEARFLQGDPITMGVSDIANVSKAAPKAKIIAVHMDTINHCLLTRVKLKKTLDETGVKGIVIPQDGELIEV
ncbi:MAG TPA: MBL fold metallo-hydrolase [Cyclobacteriaceae bacterium]|jgi:L-ascorbate metabolism protein UlaG (beta-lactamase superfamily)|nr:MBL fold metallo-hydrolase [Cyclobacteriaceae bacterium]